MECDKYLNMGDINKCTASAEGDLCHWYCFLCDNHGTCRSIGFCCDP